MLLLLASFIYAQEKPLETDYPEVLGLEPKTIDVPIPIYFKYIFNFIIIVSTAVAVAVLATAGLSYLSSSNNPEKVKIARDRIKSAIFGLILLFASWIILYTINPQLTIFSIPGLKETEINEPSPPPLNTIFSSDSLKSL